MKLDAPKIKAELERVPFNAIFHSDDLELEDVLVIDSEYEHASTGRVRISNSVVRNCSFTGTAFESVDFLDVRFENCDFSNANLSKSSIHRVQFSNCKLLGADFSKSSLGNVCFEGSIIQLSSFANSKLEKVIFQRSALMDSDFYECKFKKIVFDQCDIDRASFDRTPLKDVDLSTSEFNGLTVSIEDLKGCKVSKLQAIQFASLLGLIVKE